MMRRFLTLMLGALSLCGCTSTEPLGMCPITTLPAGKAVDPSCIQLQGYPQGIGDFQNNAWSAVQTISGDTLFAMHTQNPSLKMLCFQQASMSCVDCPTESDVVEAAAMSMQSSVVLVEVLHYGLHNVAATVQDLQTWTPAGFCYDSANQKYCRTTNLTIATAIDTTGFTSAFFTTNAPLVRCFDLCTKALLTDPNSSADATQTIMQALPNACKN